MGKYDSFLEELSSRLSQRGLLVKRGMGLDPYQLDILAIANAYEASKFGKMTRFITAASMDNVDAITVKDFSSRATQFSLENRESLLPRGFGGSLLSVPTIVSMSFSDDVKDWIGKNRPPKHFAAFEFPVLVSTADRQIYYYQKTPIWGAAYYKGFRKFVEEVLGFK